MSESKVIEDAEKYLENEIKHNRRVGFNGNYYVSKLLQELTAMTKRLESAEKVVDAASSIFNGPTAEVDTSLYLLRTLRHNLKEYSEVKG